MANGSGSTHRGGSLVPGSLSRRRFVGGATTAGLLAAAAGLVACSSKNTNNAAAKATTSAPSGQSTATAAPAGVGTTTAATRAAAATSPSPVALDSTKGKPGGTFTISLQAYPDSFAVITHFNSAAVKIFGFPLSGLLAFNYGRPPSNGLDIVPELDLATAMPEQPDNVTYVFKLKPGVKFQNGRPLTSDDVKYSFDAYANGDKNGPSARASSWTWYDSTQTPDAQTAIVKSKMPYADTIADLCQHADAFIIAREFEEGPDYANKVMGTGPFLFDSTNNPTTIFKKNPNFYDKPYPYFDQITAIARTDSAKEIADFTSRQLQLTYYYYTVDAQTVKKARPDALAFSYFSAADAVAPRVDQPPFNDKRVRQALSMAINRAPIRDATYGGGADDQLLSPVMGTTWGFRTPSQLGASAKYWTYDVQSARQLLAAAGVTLPIANQMLHPDVTFGGQQFVDEATLIEAQWKQAGIADIKDNTVTTALYASGFNVGNFDGIGLGRASQQQPAFGNSLKALLWSPPEGVKAPTQNVGHINDPDLSNLVDKQLGQLNLPDRLQTLHSMEDLLADQQYRIILSTYPITYYADGSLRNAIMPKWVYAGSYHFIKYWWLA